MQKKTLNRFHLCLAAFLALGAAPAIGTHTVAVENDAETTIEQSETVDTFDLAKLPGRLGLAEVGPPTGLHDMLICDREVYRIA